MLRSLPPRLVQYLVSTPPPHQFLCRLTLVQKSGGPPSVVALPTLFPFLFEAQRDEKLPPSSSPPLSSPSSGHVWIVGQPRSVKGPDVPLGDTSSHLHS